MTTPRALITMALKDAGIIGQGQTASAEDMSDAFIKLNQMLAQWRSKRWLVYRLSDNAFTSTGAVSYTVGPSGNFNVVRPDRIEGAYYRQVTQTAPNQTDYPLKLIQSREDYSRISLKQLSGPAEYIWYDSQFPLGSVFPWPVLQASIWALHILLKEPLPQFTSLSETVLLPLEYEPAITWNLGVRLRPAYQLPPDIGIANMANESLNVLKTANAQVPRLQMPRTLIAPGVYNIYADRWQ